LPPDKRSRHGAIKAEIREWARRLEAVKGAEAMQALDRLTALRQELGALIEAAVGKDVSAAGAMAAAGVLLGQGGAIVAPIVTTVGSKILVVRAGGIKALDVPDLSTERLNVLVRGESKEGRKGGWFAAYAMNCIPDPSH